MAIRKRKPVSGTFKVGKDRLGNYKVLGKEEHHLGWDRALQAALDGIGWPRGQHYAHIQFSAVIDVKNPGSVIEYIATIS